MLSVVTLGILDHVTDRSFRALAALNTAVFSWAIKKGTTMLDEMEKQLLQQFEEQDRLGGITHEARSGEVLTRISLQNNRHGEPVFRYWFGDSLVDRRTFQTLTCSETRCPQHQALLQKWKAHMGMTRPSRPVRSEPPGLCSLAVEKHVRLGDRMFTAREARFPVTLECKNNSHTPLRISVKGWDVFGEEGYLAGGWAEDAPMFETLEQVNAWLQMQGAQMTPTLSTV